MMRRHRAAHRAIWLALALLLPTIFVAGLYLRWRVPGGATSVRLEAPR